MNTFYRHGPPCFKFENNTSGRAQLWDTALKFLPAAFSWRHQITWELSAIIVRGFTRLTVLCERNGTKRNGAERNEMESVVCEMKIYSLRNKHFHSRCVYSDILNIKFHPQKAISPCAECATFSLARIKFKFSSGVFEWRTLTGSKTSSLFICLDATTFVLITVNTLIETICLSDAKKRGSTVNGIDLRGALEREVGLKKQTWQLKRCWNLHIGGART